jgi:hypothetical protein
VVRGLAETHGLRLHAEEDDDDGERGTSTEGGTRQTRWQQPRIWAAFAIYGA